MAWKQHTVGDELPQTAKLSDPSSEKAGGFSFKLALMS